MILLLLICCPLALCLGLSLLGARFRSPWRLYMVFGKKGSGKSTFLAKKAVQYMRKGFTVYTNMPDMCIQGVRCIDVNDLGDFVPESHSLLLCDEVGMIWDNRNFKNFKPSVRDFFKLQRHYKVVCYLASQSFDIDKKLRDLTDGMFLVVNIFGMFSIAKRIYKSITLTESTSEAESRIAENLKFSPFWNWEYTLIPRWAKYFESFTVPDLPALPYSELSGIPVKVKNKKARK